MNELEKQVFKKLLDWCLNELSNEFSSRGCNDLDEKVLKLSNDEKQIAVNYLNYFTEEPVEMHSKITSDFQVPVIIKGFLKMYFSDKEIK